MTLREAVDAASADCEMRRLFFQICEARDYFYAIDWLCEQPGVHQGNLNRLKEMVAYEEYTDET